jgi:hypothetical protein
MLSIHPSGEQLGSSRSILRVQEAPMAALVAAKNNQNLLRKTSDSMS